MFSSQSNRYSYMQERKAQKLKWWPWRSSDARWREPECHLRIWQNNSDSEQEQMAKSFFPSHKFLSQQISHVIGESETEESETGLNLLLTVVKIINVLRLLILISSTGKYWLFLNKKIEIHDLCISGSLCTYSESVLFNRASSKVTTLFFVRVGWEGLLTILNYTKGTCTDQRKQPAWERNGPLLTRVLKESTLLTARLLSSVIFLTKLIVVSFNFVTMGETREYPIFWHDPIKNILPRKMSFTGWAVHMGVIFLLNNIPYLNPLCILKWKWSPTSAAAAID